MAERLDPKASRGPPRPWRRGTRGESARAGSPAVVLATDGPAEPDPGQAPGPSPGQDPPGGRQARGLGEGTGQFLRFSVVGTIAFLIDAATLQSALWLGLDPYSGRVVSYLVAATGAWVLNRHYTFRLGAAGGGLLREWAQYLVANAVGGLANYATYAACLLMSDLMRAWPVLAVAAGSGVGLTFNFLANKYYVFRRALARGG